MAYNKAQIERIGNMLVYLTSKVGPMPKTKLLKLIYILEEEAIKKSGIPFTELSYQCWTQGPVSSFVNKQIDKSKEPLNTFINISKKGNAYIVSAAKDFNNDEFSDFDIELMDNLINSFGAFSAQRLVNYTHREGSLWHKKHVKYEGKQPPLKDMDLNLFELLEEKDIHDSVKASSKEHLSFKEYLKK